MASIETMLHGFRLCIGSKKIRTVVVTGGPCSGKTMSLKMIRAFLERHGYFVVVVPEMARELIASGFHPANPAWKDSVSFQRRIARGTLEKEFFNRESLWEMNVGNRPVIFVCDRGLMDSAAYVGKERFAGVLRSLGVANVDLARDRYDLVIHLDSAANGAEEHYVNDSERHETPAEARALDEATFLAWSGHPNHARIDNSTSFAGKIERAISTISAWLDLPVSQEIEVKHLVRNFRLDQIPSAAEKTRIEQAYLNIPGMPGEVECRVRVKRSEDGGCRYYYTEKVPTGTKGLRMEHEEAISHARHEELIKLYSIPHCKAIVKDRYEFHYEGRLIELDAYRGELEGLVTLEVEVPAPEDLETVELPPQLDCIDVTEDDRFSNRMLSQYGSLLMARLGGI